MPDVIVTGKLMPENEPTLIMPGIRLAFKNTKLDADYFSLYAHDKNKVLGRKSAGTYRVWELDGFLEYEANIGDPSRDSLVSMLDYRIERGEIKSTSAGLSWKPENASYYQDKSGDILILVDGATLREGSFVPRPQYQNTTAEKKLEDNSEIEIARARMELISHGGA